MDYLDALKPGKRDNAFFLERDITEDDKIGILSPLNEEYYIYIWNREKKKHIAKLIKRSTLDTLG